MFEKAQRKVAECAFFLSQLREPQDPDATEFFFNALLNAGKNVVYALQAQIYTCERMRLPDKQAKLKARQSYDRYCKEWKGSISGSRPTLFHVLQDSRDIETHVDSSAVRFLPKIEERQQRRDVPRDPHYTAVIISYMQRCVLSDHVTVPTTIYYLQVDPAVSSKKRVQVRFKQFAKGNPKLLVELASTYTNLLDLLVAYFIAHYV